MKILITGGAGFIGSNFIRMVFSKYPDSVVTNVDKLGVGSNPANLKDLENKKRYKFVKGDISDFELVRELIKDIDVIVNVAAETHVDRSIANPLPFVQSNAIGTFNLLEAMRRFNDDPKLVQVSTDEVYGDVPEGSFKESDLLKPSSSYASSKAAADLFCLAHHRTYGLNIVITRCTNNFGPYQFPEKLIPKAIIRASMNLEIPIYGSGKNIRDWIYVHDHCEALDVVLQEGKLGEIYNISGENEMENVEVVKKVLNLMEKDESLIEFVEDRPGHDIRYSLDSSKIRDELGWRPKYDFEDALKRTVNWYSENEWWWRPLVTGEILHPSPWKLKW
jgi:dTDP-glucose 4,6-dehydratase